MEYDKNIAAAKAFAAGETLSSVVTFRCYNAPVDAQMLRAWLVSVSNRRQPSALLEQLCAGLGGARQMTEQPGAPLHDAATGDQFGWEESKGFQQTRWREMNEASVCGLQGPAWAGPAGFWGFQWVSKLGQDSGAVCSAAE